MKLRLLKFDTINPEVYLRDKINENMDAVESMNRKELLEWIISQRANFSDFYTYNLRSHGWDAEEFIITDKYLEKTADELYGNKIRFIKTQDKIKDFLRPTKHRMKLNIITDYIRSYKPDVILVREQSGVPSDLWKNCTKHSLIVSRLAAPMPYKWAPSDFDVILTSTELYKNFFEINNVRSYINDNGFDVRILNELKNNEKKYDATFVGGLGNRFWKSRTKLIDSISKMDNFKWWGYNGDEFPEDHSLKSTWQGITSGLEMLQIYKDSKIVINDYGEIAHGEGVNQRIFEVMGVGTLLLTRDSEKLQSKYPSDIFVTFTDDNDCRIKINYYLEHETEREEIARRGQEFILENYNYDKLMKNLSDLLKDNYYKKFEPEHYKAV